MTTDFPGRPLPNSYWVVPGRLLAGEYPGTHSRADTLQRLKSLMDAGMDFFIDLTHPQELPGYEGLLPLTSERTGREVVYLRKPLRDHSIPEHPQMMVEILTAMREALAEGHGVYLHCRAGIGRTGTSIGCHLIEGGMTPAAALEHLQTLWAANARSVMWPQTPETEEQTEYVLGWLPRLPRIAGPAPERLPEPAPAHPAPRLSVDEPELPGELSREERFRGALLGLAIGDALGAEVQQSEPGSFAPLALKTDAPLEGGGRFDLPPGAWTDDTAMALCLAESLVARRGLNADDQMRRYQHWQREGHCTSTGRALGTTPAVAKALATAQWSGKTYAGSHDPARLDKEVLTRIAPVAMFFVDEPEKAVEAAAEAARITHQAPALLDACRYFAGLLLGALRGADKQALLAPGFAPVADLWQRRSLRAPVDTLLTPRRTAPEIYGGGNALDALQAVLWALKSSDDFATGLLLAVNLGRDSDVTGALYGQLAGALYGVAAIPEAWRRSLVQGEAIDAIAQRLMNRE